MANINSNHNTDKETYMYFAENLGANASGDCAVWPASSFLGLDPISDTTSRISFQALTGNLADDDVLVTHATGKYKELCQGMAEIMNSKTTRLVVVFDEDNTIQHPTLAALGCAITELNITLDT